MKKKETRGRNPLPEGQRKPPQATLKVNKAILPFVLKLKSNLKLNLVSEETIQRLFDVLSGRKPDIVDHKLLPNSIKVQEFNRLEGRIFELEAELKTVKAIAALEQKNHHD